MDDHYYTTKEVKDFIYKLPKKTVAVKAFIFSETKKVLLLKPNYLPGWNLPGGSVNEFEDPKKAIVREVKEEIGIKFTITDFVLFDSYFDKRYDNLILIYICKKKINENIFIKLEKSELKSYKFEQKDNIYGQLSDIKTKIILP